MSQQKNDRNNSANTKTVEMSQINEVQTNLKTFVMRRHFKNFVKCFTIYSFPPLMEKK